MGFMHWLLVFHSGFAASIPPYVVIASVFIAFLTGTMATLWYLCIAVTLLSVHTMKGFSSVRAQASPLPMLICLTQIADYEIYHLNNLITTSQPSPLLIYSYALRKFIDWDISFEHRDKCPMLDHDLTCRRGKVAPPTVAFRNPQPLSLRGGGGGPRSQSTP